eukprot:8251444-Pyramimonas_sp.AAC.1
MRGSRLFLSPHRHAARPCQTTLIPIAPQTPAPPAVGRGHALGGQGHAHCAQARLGDPSAD